MALDLQEIKKNKYKPSLVYESFIKATAEVRQFGLTKYPDSENWRNYEISEFLDGALRHLNACKKELYSKDIESNLLHIAHAACNLMFLIEGEKDENNKD